VFDSLVVRAGAGIVFGNEKAANGSSHTTTLLMSMPVTIGWLEDPDASDHFEAELGAVILHAAPHATTFYVKDSPSAVWTVGGTAAVGYRYQPPDGGLFFRAGASLLVSRYGVLPLWPYASFGVTF
jgi:hypothetical protein